MNTTVPNSPDHEQNGHKTDGVLILLLLAPISFDVFSMATGGDDDETDDDLGYEACLD
jgi:hypothetical protein